VRLTEQSVGSGSRGGLDAATRPYAPDRSSLRRAVALLSVPIPPLGGRVTVTAAVPDTRQRILEATAQCIAEIGVAEVRMAGIARAAGVSTALLHYHFETKEQLFEAALRHSYESSTILDQETLRSEGLTAAERLAAYLVRCLPTDATLTRDLLLWQEFAAMSPRHTAMAAVTADLFDGDVERVAAIIRDGIDDGSFAPVDAALVARTAIALCDGLCTRVLSGDPRVTLSEARRTVAEAVGALLGSAEPLPLDPRQSSKVAARSATPTRPIPVPTQKSTREALP
jgi:AcrR family transcriptional regulator